MVSLYITSSKAGVGKTTICAGVGKNLLDNGKRTGYLKLSIVENTTDSDAVFMKGALALEETVDNISPLIADQDNPAGEIKEACAMVSQDKDIVIIEDIDDKSPAEYSKVAEALAARVIIVEGYSKGLSQAKLIDSAKGFGEQLLGVVLNKVPRSQLKQVQEELSTQLNDEGINVLGVLPEDRTLFTLTVGELAEHLKGEILNSDEKAEELVENFMLGAMYVDSGPEYFGRKSNKAVVVRGERPDMQLAALETPTRCLVLSGDSAPAPAVLHRAEEKKIPIILTKEDVLATVTAIEEALSKNRFNQEKKLARLAEIMEQHFNFRAMYQGLGLAKQDKPA